MTTFCAGALARADINVNVSIVATPTATKYTKAETLIVSRKAHIAAMLAELAAAVDAVEPSRDYGVAGDLGQIESTLADLLARHGGRFS